MKNLVWGIVWQQDLREVNMFSLYNGNHRIGQLGITGGYAWWNDGMAFAGALEEVIKHIRRRHYVPFLALPEPVRRTRGSCWCLWDNLLQPRTGQRFEHHPDVAVGFRLVEEIA